MSKLGTKFRYMYDAAPTAELIAKDGAVHAASFNGPSHVLDTVGGYWNNAHELADLAFAVAVNVTSLDRTTGDETYTIELEFGNAGYAASVKTHKIAVTKPGQYVFLVDIPTAQAIVANLNEFRVVATLAGTTPSITLNAWMAGEIIDGL